MSCCGGNCGCGSGCKCGNGCGGCSMYPGLSYSEADTVAVVAAGTLVLGFEKIESGAEMEGAENGCKCGANCSCDPCTCK